MNWLAKHWLVMVVAVLVVSAGAGLAMIDHSVKPSSDRMVELDGDTSGPEELVEVDDIPTVVSPKSSPTKSTSPSNYSIPTLPIVPPDLVPWKTGPSAPSTGGGANDTNAQPSIPSSSAPWGSGPSQQ